MKNKGLKCLSCGSENLEEEKVDEVSLKKVKRGFQGWNKDMTGLDGGKNTQCG